MTSQEAADTPTVEKVSEETWQRLVKELCNEWARAAEHYLEEEGVYDVEDTATIMLAAAARMTDAVRFSFSMTMAGFEPPSVVETTDVPMEEEEEA